MSTSTPALVLASRSPRRLQLLAQLGVAVTVSPADIDETVGSGESPRNYVERIAREKVSVIEPSGNTRVLGADTAVVLDDIILGKPENPSSAQRILQHLSGRTHSVFTAVALRCPDASGCLRGNPGNVPDAIFAPSARVIWPRTSPGTRRVPTLYRDWAVPLCAASTAVTAMSWDCHCAKPWRCCARQVSRRRSIMSSATHER